MSAPRFAHPNPAPRTPGTTPVTPTVPDRARIILIGFAAPVVISLVTMAVLGSWLGDLPDRVAVHWGPGGANGFASPATVLWLALLPIAIAAGFTAFALWRGYQALTRRTCVATSLFLAVFMALVASFAIRGDWSIIALVAVILAVVVLAVLVFSAAQVTGAALLASVALRAQEECHEPADHQYR